MFRTEPSGAFSLKVEHAPSQMPLISIVQVGDAVPFGLVKAALRETERWCSAAWAFWGSQRSATRNSLKTTQAASSGSPDVVYVLMTTNNGESVARAQIALEASSAAAKFLLLDEAKSNGPVASLKDLTNGIFVSATLDLLLTPLRWMSAPPGLIGIDLDDHMTVCAGRWVYLETVAISVLGDVISTRPPFQGLTLSFGPLPLSEIDAIVDHVKAAVTEDVDFVWHDAPWHSDKNTVDVCFAYDNPLEDVPDRCW